MYVLSCRFSTDYENCGSCPLHMSTDPVSTEAGELVLRRGSCLSAGRLE